MTAKVTEDQDPRSRPDRWTMGVLQDFERRLEGAVEGFFARVFRSGIQPIELAKAVQRYALDNQHVTADGVVVPNVYRLTVGPKDHDRLEGFGASLPRELAEVVVSTASERGWLLRGPAKVRIDVDDDVKFGRFRLAGRVEAVDPPPPQPAEPRARNRSHPSPPPPSATAGDRTPPPPAASSAPPPEPAADRVSAPSFDQTQVVTQAADPGFHLVVRQAQQGGGASVPLQGNRMTVGRLERCDLTVNDATVSREHAAFVRRGDRWWVVDLGSTNGTKVNGRRAAEHPLQPGDEVELGEAVVQFVGG